MSLSASRRCSSISTAALGTFLLSRADSLEIGVLAFRTRSFTVLYGLTWTFYAFAGAIGPVLMGKAFDATGSYETLLARLALVTLVVATLMLLLPRYAPLEKRSALPSRSSAEAGA